MIRVDLVDAPAFTPPYDHSLAAALARAGADVRLVTSRFAYGAAPVPEGYELLEHFYRHAVGRPGSRLRRAWKLAEHLPDMLAYEPLARVRDLVHFQWLGVPAVDALVMPDRPIVLTAHDLLPRDPRPGQLGAQRRVLRRADAVVVHSEYGRRSLLGGVPGLDEARVHVIRHGAFCPPDVAPELPTELAVTDSPVALCFGLIRPYKGIATLLEAWRGVRGAELWIVGRPMMDLGPLRAAAPPSVRFVTRFVTEAEQAAVLARADVVVLPYEATERYDFSGVLASALGYGKAIVASDVGGFAEVGAVSLVPPGDAAALRSALSGLLTDPRAREELSLAASRAAAGPYSWDAVALRTLELYETIRRA